MINHKNQLIKEESGLVSFIVTALVMIILSLIVLGFAQQIRREQRQTLDRQLNTQAFYAAESGVNDAIKVVKGNISYAKSSCSTTLPFPYNNPVLDTPAGVVSYSCILVDPTPTTLVFDDIETDQSRIVPIIPSGTLQNLDITWQDTTSSPTFSDCRASVPGSAFPSLTNWAQPGRPKCPGVLRVDIVAIPAGGFTRDYLLNNTRTAFLYPLNTGSSAFSSVVANPGLTSQGVIAGVNCGAPSAPPASRQCKARFTLPSSNYYLRIKSIYKPSAVTVSAENSSGTLLPLGGAQAVIDSTGKANDVLKRVQVRIPITLVKGSFPELSIDSLGSICKRMVVIPPTTIIVNPSVGADPACKIP